MSGTSLTPVLRGTTELSHSVLFWQYLNDWRAVRQGKWKASKLGNSTTWYLFDLEKDRAETTDVSKQNGAKLGELKALWDKWKANSYTTVGWNMPPVYTPGRRGSGPRSERIGAIGQDRRSVRMRIDSPAAHHVRLSTLTGRTVCSRSATGAEEYVLGRTSYRAGWYLLEVVAGGEWFTEQVMMES